MTSSVDRGVDPRELRVAELEQRILAVDDQPTNLLLVRRQMERLGVFVDQAVDGAEALERTSERFYPLILVDCEMPVMDGYEFTRQVRLKETGGARRSVIIALSARDPGEERQRCLDAGMDEFLVKPASLTDLKALIDRHLRTEADEPGAAPANGSAAPTQIIDWPRFAVIMGSDDPATQREMLILFRDSAGPTMEKLTLACQAVDRDAVQRLAHRAKGGAGNIAAIELAAALAILETTAETADPETLVRLADEARASFRRVTEAITARLAA